MSSQTYRQHLELYYDREKVEWQNNESSDEESSVFTEALYDDFTCANEVMESGEAIVGQTTKGIFS